MNEQEIYNEEYVRALARQKTFESNMNTCLLCNKWITIGNAIRAEEVIKKDSDGDPIGMYAHLSVGRPSQYYRCVCLDCAKKIAVLVPPQDLIEFVLG